MSQFEEYLKQSFGDLLKLMQDTGGFGTQYDPAKFSNIEAVVNDGLNINPVADLGYDVSPLSIS